MNRFAKFIMGLRFRRADVKRAEFEICRDKMNAISQEAKRILNTRN